MNIGVSALVEKIRALEDEIEERVSRRRADLKFRIEQGRVLFEEEMLRHQRQFKVALHRYVFGARLFVILTAPFIYMLIVPFVLMDLFVSVYQSICFPVYKIPKVRRAKYFVFDRERLAYLNGIEKLNCAYCTYCNAVVAYVREVASRTEFYWCPIKHARRVASVHQRYNDFADFGDADGYRQNIDSMRHRLSQERDA